MYRFIINKVIASIITFFVVVVLLYFLVAGLKGNPYTYDPMTYPDIEDYWKLLDEYGLRNPVWVRFGNYIAGIFNGDWGDVYVINRTAPTIPQMFFQPLAKSMLVAVPSYFIGMVFGLGLGYWAGYRRGKVEDTIINGFVTLFVAVPIFVFASYALVLGPILGLPVIFLDPEIWGWGEAIPSLVMPILVSSLTSLSFWTIYTRIDVASILKTDYILAARTKGFSEWKVFKSYVLRNAMYNYIGSISVMFMVVFSSSIVIERFFNVPGTSNMLNQAMKAGEVNIIMFNMIFFSGLGIGTEVISSVAIYSINPLVKASFASKTSLILKWKVKLTRERNELRILEQENKDNGGASND